jgi:hypothetical protein
MTKYIRMASTLLWMGDHKYHLNILLQHHSLSRVIEILLLCNETNTMNEITYLIISIFSYILKKKYQYFNLEWNFEELWLIFNCGQKRTVNTPNVIFGYVFHEIKERFLSINLIHILLESFDSFYFIIKMTQFL